MVLRLKLVHKHLNMFMYVLQWSRYLNLNIYINKHSPTHVHDWTFTIIEFTFYVDSQPQRTCAAKVSNYICHS